MVENELYHHGRKGQKWGKRNGPPYPLDKEGKKKFKQNRKELDNKAFNVVESKDNYEKISKTIDDYFNDPANANKAATTNDLLLLNIKELKKKQYKVALNDYKDYTEKFIKEYGNDTFETLKNKSKNNILFGEKFIYDATNALDKADKEMFKNVDVDRAYVNYYNNRRKY